MDKQHRILTIVQLAHVAPLGPVAHARTLTSEDGEEAGSDGKIFGVQLTIDGDSGDDEKSEGKVSTVYANPPAPGGSSNGHDSGNAKTHMDVGLGLGRAMAKWFGGQN